MAEVLITLGIIGVVAALTLPSLIHKHQMKVLESQFKKAYAVIENVNLQMINNDINPYEDYVRNRNEDKAVKQVEDFAKFTNGARICDGSYLTCIVGNNDDDKKTKYIYKNIDGKSKAHIDPDAYIKKTILMPDGMTIWVGGLLYSQNRYYVDINGTTKKPNKLGYDLFTFLIGENNAINPEKENYNNFTCSFIKKAFTPAYLGFGCGYYAAGNQNPDEEGKTYWQDFLK